MQSIVDFILREEAIKEELYIKQTIMETKGDPIDDQWLNDEKPVMTKDGRQVIIVDIDMKEVPNIIKGQVKIKDKLFEYEWLDAVLVAPQILQVASQALLYVWVTLLVAPQPLQVASQALS